VAVPTPSRRRPTLDQVAQAVGVSRATVYNRPDQLSAQLRVRVLREAKRLGYPGPDPTARSLATSRTGAIAVLLGAGLSAAFSDPALSVTLDALATVVDAEEKALLLLPGADGDGPRADRVLAAQADVAVAYSLADGARALRAVRQRGLPLVIIDQPSSRGAAMVRVADKAGAVAAAQHLLDLGHRRFGILSASCLGAAAEGPLSVTQARAIKVRHARERLAGYWETLAAAGIPAESVPIWETSGLSIADAQPAALGLLNRTPRPTALLCMSDQLALAALAVAAQLGIDVPGELSVVGYDDAPPASWSGLTTVHQDLVGKGRLAGELALRLLTGARAASPEVLPVELVVRGSTGPASP
jgi:DNA-binding LacI/PurR family transcriptional regulator